MCQKEAPRVGLLKALAARRVTGGEVAAALHLRQRQVRRLRRRFEAEGAGGLVHRSRGRPSPRRLAQRARMAIGQMDGRSLLLGPDCSINPDTPEPLLHAAGAAVRAAPRA